MISSKRIQALFLLILLGVGTEGWQVIRLPHGAKVDTKSFFSCSNVPGLPGKMRTVVTRQRSDPLMTGFPVQKSRTKCGLSASIPLSPQSDSLGHGRYVRRFAMRCVVSLVLALCVLVVGQAAAVASATTATTTSGSAVATAVRLYEPPLTAMWELRLTMRLVYAALTGAAIGKERSGLRYHPAGVRTLSLVALGAALFTICSRHGFAGTHYDTSRMASNVASGVGFIGAGVIYHEQQTEVVHGLTTAAAIWISAAVGVASGCGLYVLSSAATLATLGILRIGGAVKVRKRRKRKIPLEIPQEEPEDDVFPPQPRTIMKQQDLAVDPPPPPHPPALEISPFAAPPFSSTTDYLSKITTNSRSGDRESRLDYRNYDWIQENMDDREMHAYFLKSIVERSRVGKNHTLYGEP